MNRRRTPPTSNRWSAPGAGGTGSRRGLAVSTIEAAMAADLPLDLTPEEALAARTQSSPPLSLPRPSAGSSFANCSAAAGSGSCTGRTTQARSRGGPEGPKEPSPIGPGDGAFFPGSPRGGPARPPEHCALHDAGRNGSRCWIAYQYVEGRRSPGCATWSGSTCTAAFRLCGLWPTRWSIRTIAACFTAI